MSERPSPERTAAIRECHECKHGRVERGPYHERTCERFYPQVFIVQLPGSHRLSSRAADAVLRHEYDLLVAALAAETARAERYKRRLIRITNPDILRKGNAERDALAARLKDAQRGLRLAVEGLELAATVHEAIAMDSDEDEAIKLRAVATMRLALSAARAALAALQEAPPNEPPTDATENDLGRMAPQVGGGSLGVPSRGEPTAP